MPRSAKVREPVRVLRSRLPSTVGSWLSRATRQHPITCRTTESTEITLAKIQRPALTHECHFYRDAADGGAGRDDLLAEARARVAGGKNHPADTDSKSAQLVFPPAPRAGAKNHPPGQGNQSGQARRSALGDVAVEHGAAALALRAADRLVAHASH